jgi:hypothetical protein
MRLASRVLKRDRAAAPKICGAKPSEPAAQDEAAINFLPK